MKNVLSGLVAAALFIASGADAVVSQVPLVGTSSFVAPNLMFTLDDSGSMDWECLPDALCIDGGTYVRVAPVDDGWMRNATVTFATDSLLGRQMRSTVNPLYYNPAVRYRPWMKPDGTRFPAHPATATPPDPMAPAATVDLTAPQTVTTYWCTSRTNCATSAQTFSYLQYHTLAPGRAGASVADYTQVLIRPATAAYPKSAARDDCAAATGCTYAEELQNFANWFTYARTRLKVAIGGTSQAFLAVPAAYRVGFGTINSTGTTVDGGATGNTVRSGVRPFSGAAKTDFYAMLQQSSVNGATPLRRALDDVGRYFSRSDNHGPWAENPALGQAASSHLGCRRSFHVLMTDGLWNQGAASTPEADADVDSTPGPMHTSADGTRTWRYVPGAPYAGAGGSTLADVAMYYWSRDLRPDLPDNLRPNDANPAFWQHLVNYTVAFGLNGRLRNPDDRAALDAGTLGWGDPGSDEVARVDDLWHAAINSRGLARSATNADAYAQALESIISDIASRSGSEAGVAVSGRNYTASTRKYVPSYSTSDWSGDIAAVQLSDQAEVWRASSKLPAPADRRIFTYKDGATGAVPFTRTALDTAGMTPLLGATDAPGLIGYLRGVRTGEGLAYRKRRTPLGDIVNSSPVLVSDLLDASYDFLPDAAPGRTAYPPYLANKKARTPHLFVGSNDGMLHAFNDGPGDERGREVFAFLPRAVLGQVRQLADPAYAHRFFVDGPIAEADVFDTTAGRWRNLVLGSGGAGAKNVFAMNVPVRAAGATQPLTDAQSAPGAQDILWEVSSAVAGFGELGHVLQSPEAGVLRDGRWIVAVGNGYDSASRRAQLVLMDAITGARIAVLDTGVGNAAAPNGLGGVTLLRDLQQRVVAAYAGDLRGNLWKFDLSSPTPTDWGVAFGGQPLFKAVNTAGAAEPITAAPAYVAHPKGGVMVLAGSGKLFESDDPADLDQRTLYGVWDKVPVGQSSSNAGDRVIGNASLVTQTLTPLVVGDVVSTRYFEASNNAVDYGTGTTARKRGWKLRMTAAPGQRLIWEPQVEGGRVFFDTLVPGDTASSCSLSVPRGFLFVLDAFTGGPDPRDPTFDTNRDGVFDHADAASAAGVWTGDVGKRGLVRGEQVRIRLEGSGEGPPEEAELPRGSVSRQWRQLVKPPAY